MDRALADDVPIEARMVTRAIERAQNTASRRTPRGRKDVLKYDEVMNEQRKVVYERRIADHRRRRSRRVHDGVASSPDQRRGGGLLPFGFSRGVGPRASPERGRPVLPEHFSAEDLNQAETLEQLTESIVADAVEFYESRATALGVRSRSRPRTTGDVAVIDQIGASICSKMDHLREGIHLRGIAQTDPLVACSERVSRCSGI